MSADSADDDRDAFQEGDALDALFAEAPRPGRFPLFAFPLGRTLTELFHQLRIGWSTCDDESYRRSLELFETSSRLVLGAAADRDRAFALRAEVQRIKEDWEATFASEAHGEEVFDYRLRLERAIAAGTPLGRVIAENDPWIPVGIISAIQAWQEDVWAILDDESRASILVAEAAQRMRHPWDIRRYLRTDGVDERYLPETPPEFSSWSSSPAPAVSLLPTLRVIKTRGPFLADPSPRQLADLRAAWNFADYPRWILEGALSSLRHCGAANGLVDAIEPGILRHLEGRVPQVEVEEAYGYLGVRFRDDLIERRGYGEVRINGLVPNLVRRLWDERGRAVRYEVLESEWEDLGGQDVPLRGSIRAQIGRCREEIRPLNLVIETVRGLGYRLIDAREEEGN